ncbi:cupin domain-containing protein [Bordetella sp. N]|uniref:cupin domain-containing protein n=1 Tax=Bordetella sp. N TaxID=1746199 RepID=UPI000710D534|nr:cupin domain-containing protein [Bordetella sp. N]ALM83475.1 XRE family transcriptional regulator [Bordetella sp. N]
MTDLRTPAPDAAALELGTRLKHARLARKMTLKDCALKADCSESQVSKVERGLVAPSLAMLHRLAAALDTNVSYLIGERPASGPVLRQGSRLVSQFVHGQGGIQLERLDNAERGSLLQAHIHIIPPGARSDGQIEHLGEEVGIVLEGTVLLTLGDTQYTLQAGDAFHFPSQVPHGYENAGPEAARIYWVNTPATF